MVFGEIPGYPEGSSFGDRTDLFDAGLHRRTQHGISGLPSEGADAIVLNGGYKDDRDLGDVIVCTGEYGVPVRIIRGPRGDPSPGHGPATARTGSASCGGGRSRPRTGRSSPNAPIHPPWFALK